MSATTPRRGTGLPRRRGGASALLVVLVSLVGLGLVGCGTTGARDTATGVSRDAAASAPVSPSDVTSDGTSDVTSDGTDSGQAVPARGSRVVPGPAVAVARTAPRALRPVRIRIPAIGVDAGLTDLGIGRGGAIEVPSDPAQAGWLETTPAPGQRGPAVVAGHVDSTDGPAVFYRLRDLAVGDAITLTRHDGTDVTFTVDGVRTYRKDAFPTRGVYGPAPGPVLRLITCGGDYVKARGGYQDNVVVYAS